MQLTKHTTRQAAGLLGALGAAAALASPAFATRPDDRAGIRGVNVPAAAAARPDALMRYASGHGMIGVRAAGPAAGLRPDNRAGSRGVGARAAAKPVPHLRRTTAGTASLDRHVANPVVAGRVHAASGAAFGARPDNRAGRLGEPTGVQSPNGPTRDGFDWGDYGIGMGGGVGLAALLVGMALALRHRRDQHEVALESA